MSGAVNYSHTDTRVQLLCKLFFFFKRKYSQSSFVKHFIENDNLWFEFLEVDEVATSLLDKLSLMVFVCFVFLRSLTDTACGVITSFFDFSVLKSWFRWQHPLFGYGVVPLIMQDKFFSHANKRTTTNESLSVYHPTFFQRTCCLYIWMFLAPGVQVDKCSKYLYYLSIKHLSGTTWHMHLFPYSVCFSADLLAGHVNIFWYLFKSCF